ncbi:hypothetical protein EJD97_009478 [Solanum chilense]|uniref:Dehydrogenase E1 component domain-containing protein n=1 Tax=Solanum chilense TaxID=4083 RepID=A0A6N2BSK0_SOLCI|nr:hypothetical protein EJD97_009478 [Solanum chilense]
MTTSFSATKVLQPLPLNSTRYTETPLLLITKEEELVLYEDIVLGRAFLRTCAPKYITGAKCLVLCTCTMARKLFQQRLGWIDAHISKEHNVLGGFTFIGEGILVATCAAFTSKYKMEILKEDDCDHKKGPAFEMPKVHVDGMDVLKVREVEMEVVSRARRGKAEKNHYTIRDPITTLKKYMFENNLVNEAELKAIDKKIDELVEESVEFADARPVPAAENVFADPRGFRIGPDGR